MKKFTFLKTFKILKTGVVVISTETLLKLDSVTAKM